jgi:hypothetical protein
MAGVLRLEVDVDSAFILAPQQPLHVLVEDRQHHREVRASKRRPQLQARASQHAGAEHGEDLEADENLPSDLVERALTRGPSTEMPYSPEASAGPQRVAPDFLFAEVAPSYDHQAARCPAFVADPEGCHDGGGAKI